MYMGTDYSIALIHKNKKHIFLINDFSLLTPLVAAGGVWVWIGVRTRRSLAEDRVVSGRDMQSVFHRWIIV